jgi:hypothetical protein
MTLNLTGPISLAGATAGESIAVELGQSATGTIALDDANVRTLAGVPTGAIVMPTNFYGKSNTVPFAAIEYTTAGSYTFTVPSGVSQINAVCVGGGAGCQDTPDLVGGGGALSYSNGIATTPGESLTVVVGVGGQTPNRVLGIPPTAGGDSYIQRGGTTLILAQGAPLNSSYGSVGPGGQAASGTGAVKYSGGSIPNNYGQGGAGAAGYAGNGANGTGSTGNPAPPGGGGGGGTGTPNIGGRGGGVGIVVEGPSGAGGGPSPFNATNSPGKPGSFGSGQLYGGGGSTHGDGSSGTGGGVGGVRIIYGGTGKTYPTNSAP